MKLIVPKYYKDFACRAGGCSDNCCIGWEIDIDEKTLLKYEKEGGEFGENLRKTIVKEGGISHFALCGERCPHLNSDNLCDLIIAKGHDYLCEICREHPRFYTVLGDTVYGGVGLSCEAAAELILSENSIHEYITLETDGEREACDEQLLEILLKTRAKITEILTDRSLSIVYIIKACITLAKEAQKEIDGEPVNPCNIKEITDIYSLFSDMEFLSDELPLLLQKKAEIKLDKTVNNYLHNIFAYFVDRYLPKSAEDGYVLGKIAICAASFLALLHLFSIKENLTFERALYLSKLYSKEVEYNEENIQRLEENADKILSVFEKMLF